MPKVAATVLLAGATLVNNAQSNEFQMLGEVKMIEKTENSSTSTQQKAKTTSSLSGTVTDQANQLPLAFSEVTIKELNMKTFTDSTGFFSIDLPKETSLKELTVITRAKNYVTDNRTIALTNGYTAINIKISLPRVFDMTLGKIQVIPTKK